MQRFGSSVDTRKFAKPAHFIGNGVLCSASVHILSHLLIYRIYSQIQWSHIAVMDLKCILLLLACTSFGLVLVNSTSGNSLATTLSSNQSLNAWPPSLPWTKNLADGLSMDVFWYGQDAPPSRWVEIAQNLDEILHDIDNRPGDGDRMFGTLAFEYARHFEMYFFGSIRKWEAARVVQAIRDFYFVAQDHPRELEFQLQTQNPPRRLYCRLVWSPVDPSRRNDWPVSLPWSLRVPFDYPPSMQYQLFLQFYHYGKTAITASDRTLRDSLDGIIAEVNQGGPRDGIVSKGIVCAWYFTGSRSEVSGEQKGGDHEGRDGERCGDHSRALFDATSLGSEGGWSSRRSLGFFDACEGTPAVIGIRPSLCQGTCASQCGSRSDKVVIRNCERKECRSWRGPPSEGDFLPEVAVRVEAGHVKRIQGIQKHASSNF